MYNENNNFSRDREFEEISKPKGMSVRDQLAMLEEKEMSDEVVKEEPILDENVITISQRMERKKDEDVFKKPKKEKVELDNKVKIGMAVITFVVVIAIVIAVLLNLQSENNKPATNLGTTDKITDTSSGTGEISDDLDINNKLSNPSEINNIEDSIEAFSKNNEVLVAYLKEMRTLVINYNNRDRNDIYIEDLMDEYEKALLLDTDILSKYKPYYDKYGASDLYAVTVSRYQNAYDMARTAKNVMTEKALVNNTNSYIGKEEELNTRAMTAFVSFLEGNDVEFKIEDNQIILK